MHEASAKHAALLISPFHRKVDDFNFFKTLWYGRRWPWSDGKGENQIWLEKRIHIPVQITIELPLNELYVIVSAGFGGTPCYDIIVFCRQILLHTNLLLI
jgi:hypothetical protein